MTLRWRRQTSETMTSLHFRNIAKLCHLLFYFPGTEKRVTPILHTCHLLPILLRTEYRTSLLTHRRVHSKEHCLPQGTPHHKPPQNISKILHLSKNKTLSQQLLNGLPNTQFTQNISNIHPVKGLILLFFHCFIAFFIFVHV